MSDELLACVMGGVYTDVEKTMIELQRHTVVRETRTAFHTAMRDRVVAMVEGLSGRRVTDFISNSHVGPTSRSSCSCSPHCPARLDR